MPTTVNRDDLVKAIPGLADQPKVLRALEELPQRIADAGGTATAAVEATQGINQATVLVLSSNDAFDNERILAVGDFLTLTDGGAGGELTLRLRYPIAVQGGYRLSFNLLADTSLTLPTDGTVATTISPGPFASDAAAASGGVGVGEQYRRSDGLVAWRQA